MIVDSGAILPRGNWMAWIVCWSAGLFFFYEFFQLNIFDVINQPLREDFHLDATQLSWMSSMYLWADILFLLPAGIILGRYSSRRVILSAMLVCIGSTMGFALTHSFLWASFFHFLSGIGNAFCFLSCVVLVAAWFPPQRQALVMGSLITMAFLGGMMAHTPLARLVDFYGWRQALLIDGVVGVVIVLWIYFVVQDRPAHISAPLKATQPSIRKAFYQAITNKQNWLAGFYTSFLNLPIMVLGALWGANYLTVVHQIPELRATQIVSVIFIGSIIGCPLVGWLSDSQGFRKPLMLIGALGTFLTAIPLVITEGLTALQLNVLFFLLGLFSSTQVISYPLIAESNKTANIGVATGIASILIMGGGGVGQILFGALMQYHAGAAVHHYVVANFQFAMWLFPLTAVAALLAVLLTRETYCKHMN